jgi:hypothetical protein
MKKGIIILSFLMSTAVLMAQNRYHQAPQSVRESFNKEYPNAEKTSWSLSNGQWSASFTHRDYGEMTAHYGKNGDHIDSHIPYTRRDVPAPVKDMVKQRYPHSRSEEYTRIDRNHGNEQFYRVKVREHGRDQTVYMDPDGKKRGYNDRH